MTLLVRSFERKIIPRNHDLNVSSRMLSHTILLHSDSVLRIITTNSKSGWSNFHTGLLRGWAVCRICHQSDTHSHTLPIMFFSPCFVWAGNAVTCSWTPHTCCHKKTFPYIFFSNSVKMNILNNFWYTASSKNLTPKVTNLSIWSAKRWPQ